MITNEDYQRVQDQILNLAVLIKQMPLKEFIEAADRAETIGPFTDPTLYLKARGRLAKIKQLAYRLKDFQDLAMIMLELF